jgi:hypothetical protein
MMKRALRYISFAFLVYVVVWSTVFIPRPVHLPERVVKLGYPISFVTLDFSTRTATPMAGAPNNLLEHNKFNITASWENVAIVSRKRFILSYVIIVLAIYGMWRITDKANRKKRLASSQ